LRFSPPSSRIKENELEKEEKEYGSEEDTP
jgi:hypothetical protein